MKNLYHEASNAFENFAANHTEEYYNKHVYKNTKIKWAKLQRDPWQYLWTLTLNRDRAKGVFIREYLRDQFRQSDLKRELMERMFHPSNIHKFADWGFGFDVE